MNTPSVNARFAQPENAESQVIEAERAALAEVEHCKRRMEQLAAEGRVLAERIRQRTEARIDRIRARMAAVARVRQEQISNEMAALAADQGTDTAVPAALGVAISRTIGEIVGISESS